MEGNSSFGYFEFIFVFDSIVTFLSNVMSIIEYHYGFECDKITSKSEKF